jgi:hypothetical protein
MELDDFKTAWKDSPAPAFHRSEELRKLMVQEGHNPLYLLRKRFRKGLRLMVVLFAIITTQLSRGGHLFHHALFWFYTGFSLIMFSYFAFSYRLSGRMMSSDKPVKAQLESQFRLLEKIFWWRKLFIRTLPFLFIGLLELVMWQTNDPGLRSWANSPVDERFAWYLGGCAVFYAITYLAFRYRYARHLEHLKTLIRELKEN